MQGKRLAEYYVFIASPGDVGTERNTIRSYFDDFNRAAARAWGVRFQVIDWENFSTAGVGRAQELITAQTLERFRENLALVIVVMAQRFGTPTAVAESGTEEEIRWALAANRDSGFPEIKIFFRDIENFVSPSEPSQIRQALEQWERVSNFRDEISGSMYFKTYLGPESFLPVLRNDLDTWLHAPERPWANSAPAAAHEVLGEQLPPAGYFQTLVDSYQWLDIAGIDSDRAFKLPLSEIYVRLRVVSSNEDETGDSAEDAAAIGIQTALARYQQLTIVGDPGSGKSTFLRFIALVLAQCTLSGDPQPAADQLSLSTPLPIPLILSCWDLSEYLIKRPRGNLDDVVEFVTERVRDAGWPISRPDLEHLLAGDKFLLLIDGLDEVPTEEGRHLVSALIEEFVGKYPRNRYVVTSRVRAYTGETVLGQQFARCDIQPFAAEERQAFLRNWVGQLFSVRGQADPTGGDAAAELNRLTEAIDTSSIRSLAINPLLLTVISIVHWNRKRLPEQRVDLYDECIDVLLGQRKQAEQQRTVRDTRVLNEEFAEKRLDQRIWVRKRFAEIAFSILNRNDEEIDHVTVVGLLEPHFRTGSEDSSREKAERFLDRQELRSGLFVRRRSISYRFVHLTFQEYLAAWFLANRDLASTLEIIGHHLRDAKWFETLQLLGGELANRSDDYLDQYVTCLLDGIGETIRDQAPVIALCANVIRDTQAVASLGSDTQSRYEALVRDTFDAFAPVSRVPKQTQLELLEALGSLGASAKDQLITATGSRLLAVRQRALEMLVPHLPDDDLFRMAHVLTDRSKEPIKTYLNALIERDPVRAARLVLTSVHGEKTLEALSEAASPRLPPDGLEMWPRLVWKVMVRFGDDAAFAFVKNWRDDRDETWELTTRLSQAGSAAAIRALAERRNDRDETWELITHLARKGSFSAIWALIELQGDRYETWELISRLGEGAIAGLAQKDRARISWIFANWILDLGVYSERWEGTVRKFVTHLAQENLPSAIVTLIKWWSDCDETWELITRLAQEGSGTAIWALLERWGHRDNTWKLITRLSDHAIARLALEVSDEEIKSFTNSWYGSEEAWELITRLAQEGCPQAIWTLADGWRDRDETWELIAQLDNTAIARLADEKYAHEIWSLMSCLSHADDARDLITRLARAGSARAIGVLTDQPEDRDETWRLITSLAQEGSIAAILDLIRHAWYRSEAWKLIDQIDDQAMIRLAQEASTDEITDFIQQGGNHEEIWNFISRLAEKGAREARIKSAWHDWAIATAGANALRSVGRI